MSKPQDHLSREQALNCEDSILLQAPAGSGKTSLLVQRYLALLARVQRPEEVVALTFTNKAVAEMRTRVLAILTSAQTEEEPQVAHERLSYDLAHQVLATSARQGWNLLQQPERLQIRTFDALALALVKRMPLLSKMHGLTTTETASDAMLGEAVDAVLEHLEEDDAAADALAVVLEALHHNREGLRDMLMAVLHKRDQWLRLVPLDEMDREVLEKNWQSLSEPYLGRVLAELGEIGMMKVRKIHQIRRAYINKPVETEPYSLLNDVAQVVFTGKGGVRQQIRRDHIGYPKDMTEEMKEELREFINEVKERQELLENWFAIKHLPMYLKYSDTHWNFLQALIQVLKLALAHLHVAFTNHGVVDFTEITQAALHALGDDESPTDLALYLDSAISHILVDEFQDTSHAQFALLEALTRGWMPDDGRTLFLVGDPMQSIYSFREADVGLFLRAKEQGIGEISLEFLALTTNFRSSPALVEWVNETFAALFPNVDDRNVGAISFLPAKPMQTCEGAWQFHGVISEDKSAEDDVLADLVKDSLKEGDAHDIAILCRTRKHVLGVLARLRKQNIGVQAVDLYPLNETQTCEDLKNLSLTLTDFANQAAWLAVLRAPWCGVVLADLQRLVDGQGEMMTLWQVMHNEDILATLTADGQRRVGWLREIVAGALSLRDRYSTTEIVSRTWQQLGGDSFGDPAVTRLFLAMLPEAVDAGGGIDIRLLDTALKDMYAQSLGTTQVLCMTIHKAKGLEFDTVIVPKLGKGKRNDDPALLHWQDHLEAGLLLAPAKLPNLENAMHEFIGNQHKERRAYEAERLFYVAATRAKRILHLTGQKQKPESSLSNWLAFIKPHIHEDSWSTIETQEEKVVHTSVKIHRRLDMNVPKFTPQTSTNIPFTPNPPKSAEQLAGTLFHKLAECGAGQPIELARAQIFIAAQLQSSSLDRATVQEISATVTTAYQHMQADEIGQWILSTLQGSKREWEILQATENHANTKLAIIDRSFIDKGVRWIVDYKLSQPRESEPLEVFLARMKQEYAPQLQYYQSLVRQFESLPIKLGLYFPLVMAWVELQ
jgi:ATP-dependent helicase/nuclease subunit A